MIFDIKFCALDWQHLQKDIEKFREKLTVVADGSCDMYVFAYSLSPFPRCLGTALSTLL